MKKIIINNLETKVNTTDGGHLALFADFGLLWVRGWLQGLYTNGLIRMTLIGSPPSRPVMLPCHHKARVRLSLICSLPPNAVLLYFISGNYPLTIISLGE